MKHTAGTLNRTWLAILGFLNLAAGVVILLQAAGILQTMLSTAPPGARIVTGEPLPFFTQTWGVVLLLALGILLAALALAWIIAQIPRKNSATTYRLHQDPLQGRTTCDPSVLAAVVAEEINALPGVVTSSALLRGTAEEPELALKITINDHADVRRLLHDLETTVVPRLSTALETPIQKRLLQLDVSARTQKAGTAVSSTGTILN